MVWSECGCVQNKFARMTGTGWGSARLCGPGVVIGVKYVAVATRMGSRPWVHGCVWDMSERILEA